MGFSMELPNNSRQERPLDGRYQKVAVLCWFTSSSRSIPKMVKYEDEEGCIQILRDIKILRSEQLHYAGILCIRYDCSVVTEGRLQEFILLYYPDTAKWSMVFQ